VSENKISQMLHDRYYLGYVEYDGEEIQGRHEPLIDEDLFDTVQEILDSRMTAQERRRVHHHYLKGSLFCGRCQRDGIKRRMIIQRTINSKGAEYLYFFCRGRQKGACQAPHVNVTLVEDAVERHYTAIRFSQPFITEMRGQIDAVLGEQEKSARLLRKQITTQLKELDTKEENLINLAADKSLPQTKIKEKLRDIASERRRLEGRLDTANADLTDSAQLVNAGLALLEQPDMLYRRCNDQQRRLLNQAIFDALYIEDAKITDGELHEPFGELHAIQRQRTTAASTQHTNEKATRDAGGPCSPSGVAVLLRGLHSGTCSSKTSKVDLFSALSHPCRRAKRLLELARDWPAESQPCQPQEQVQPQLLRTARQLSAAELDRLVVAYYDGATVYELARQFGIHRTTVGKHLRARWVDTTPLGLVPGDVPAAAELYRHGWSLARIAEKYGTTAGTVRTRLLEVGVRIRRPWEGQA